MIVQIDLENRSICHKWYSIEQIKQHTSYNIDDIKEAINDKTIYEGYLWYEWNKNSK